MGDIFKRAFEKATKELPDYEQDEIGRWLLYIIEEDEERWDATFAQSQDKLDRLAKKALQSFHAGLTEPLDPEKL